MKEENMDIKDLIFALKKAVGLKPLDIKLKKIDDRAIEPTYAHEGDVGMDLTAISVEYDFDNDMYIYHTGLSFESDYHYGIFLFPRSSNRRTEAYLCNHVGIADSAIYRGEIMLCFKNRTSLRQVALEHRTTAFFNAIDNGKNFNEANIEGMLAWKETFDNPMLFAPYKEGDRVAQMVVLPYPNVNINIVDELSATERNDGGFGSTGN